MRLDAFFGSLRLLYFSKWWLVIKILGLASQVVGFLVVAVEGSGRAHVLMVDGGTEGLFWPNRCRANDQKSYVMSLSGVFRVQGTTSAAINLDAVVCFLGCVVWSDEQELAKPSQKEQQ